MFSAVWRKILRVRSIFVAVFGRRRRSSPRGTTADQSCFARVLIKMDWDMIAASARGEGAQYEKKRKARMAQQEAKDRADQEAEKWTVSVTIKDAEVYLSTDSNGLSDPYVEVFVGTDSSWKRIGTTKVQEKTLKPVWDETFTASVNGLYRELKIKMYDKDRFGSDYVGTWKSFAQPKGGRVECHPKDNHKLITAHLSFTATWTQK